METSVPEAVEAPGEISAASSINSDTTPFVGFPVKPLTLFSAILSLVPPILHLSQMACVSGSLGSQISYAYSHVVLQCYSGSIPLPLLVMIGEYMM